MTYEVFLLSSSSFSIASALTIFLFVLSFVGYLSLNKIYFLQNQSDLCHLTIKSVILFSYLYILSVFINYFFKLDNFITILFYSVGIIIFIRAFLKKQLPLSIKWIFIIFIFILFYIQNSGANNDFHYHIHHFDLYKKYKFINFNEYILDYRVKYNSAFMLINSITYLTFSPITVKFISSFIFAAFIFDLRDYLLSKNKNVYSLKIIALFFLISVLIVLSKYKNIGTDYLAHLFYLSLILFYFYNLKTNLVFFKSKTFFLILCFFFSMLIILKISMILTLLILIHYFYLNYKSDNLKKLFSAYLIIPLLVISMWVLKNLFLSNCIMYPIKITCFVNESDMNSIMFEKYMISLYAKDIIIDYWGTSLSDLANMNSSFFFWIKSWMVNGFFEVLEKFIPITIIFYLTIFRFCKKVSYFQNYDIVINKNYLLNILLLLTTIIWFLNAPAFRFGFSYLVTFIFILNMYLLQFFKIQITNNISNNYLNKTFNLFLILFLFYQILRIYNS